MRLPTGQKAEHIRDHELQRLEKMVGDYVRWSEALIENQFPNEGDKIFALEQWSAVRAQLIGYGINW